MKRVILALGFVCLIVVNLYSQKPILKLNKYLFNITNYKATPEPNFTLRDGLNGNTAGTILYTVKGVEHIISTPWQDTVNQPVVHFIKKNGTWVFENFYENAKLHAVRNYCQLDTLGTIAFAEDDDMSFGNLWICKTSGDSLIWQKISTYTSAYSDIAAGDFNGDGLQDVVTYGGIEPNGWMLAFTQDKNGKFTANPNLIPLPPKAPPPYIPEANNLGWAVGADFLLGNTFPDIVKAEYSAKGTSRRNEDKTYGVIIFSYNPVTKAYDKLKPVTGIGIFKDSSVGATSIRFGDFNHDSKKDFAVATESDTHNDIQIFLNDGKDNFIPGQDIHFNYDSLPFREFIVDDFNGDGWPDIFLNLFNNGVMKDVFVNKGLPNQYQYFNIQKHIWINDKGVLNPLKDSLNLYATPGFLVGKKINGNLRVIGYFNDSLYTKYPTPLQIPPNQSTLIDATISFCNNVTKPIFNTSKFSICSGDSLKLTVTNINKGDTLKWYYGSKSDLSNINNKTFIDSTRLFVTKTDSLGCIVSSDTVNIAKYQIPSTPSIIRDTANYLIASTGNITWFKDGTAITDTTQKLKPSTVGSYTVKTVQNGCYSAFSSPYYYLITDIINLNTEEFIKLAPNPFNAFLNFDFILKGYQKLNLEVFEITSGLKVASRQNLIAGNQINLGELSPGTYIVKVTSQDNKISYQFKMVKI